MIPGQSRTWAPSPALAPAPLPRARPLTQLLWEQPRPSWELSRRYPRCSLNPCPLPPRPGGPRVPIRRSVHSGRTPPVPGSQEGASGHGPFLGDAHGSPSERAGAREPEPQQRLLHVEPEAAFWKRGKEETWRVRLSSPGVFPSCQGGCKHSTLCDSHWPHRGLAVALPVALCLWLCAVAWLWPWLWL